VNLTLVQNATIEPVSIAEMKSFLRIDPTNTDDDDQLALLISAARQEAEAASGRELATKQWTLTMDRFPSRPLNARVSYPGNNYRAFQFYVAPSEIRLLDPTVSVDSFVYRKPDGSPVTMAANTDYVFDSLKHPAVLVPPFNQTWPDADLWPSSAVQITFTTGQGLGAITWNLATQTWAEWVGTWADALGKNCEERYRHGIMLLVSQWYEGRIPFEAIRFVAELPFSVTSLFTSDKLWRF
jgi:hypothetical protein